MKKAYALLFLLLLFVQAVPVGHFFAKEKSIFYAYVDEDKPDDGKLKGPKACKQSLSDFLLTPVTAANANGYPHLLVCPLPSPSLEFLAPPPNTAC